MLDQAGRPLAPSDHAFFEPRLGIDLSGVRLHTGPTADAAVNAVQAKAFTVGEHIVLGSRHWSPGAAADRRLLAHELVHVAQHRRTRRRADPPAPARDDGGPGASDPGERAEAGRPEPPPGGAAPAQRGARRASGAVPRGGPGRLPRRTPGRTRSRADRGCGNRCAAGRAARGRAGRPGGGDVRGPPAPGVRAAVRGRPGLRPATVGCALPRGCVDRGRPGALRYVDPLPGNVAPGTSNVFTSSSDRGAESCGRGSARPVTSRRGPRPSNSSRCGRSTTASCRGCPRSCGPAASARSPRRRPHSCKR
ncbi:DUF4157 domain-containing protein [Kitasatospora sp. NPDC052868]|uniref:DUF4157 domain-containing protein n=1 Tax=Kitasatospora sp. NPDC052868 TaxID=3364060 RepID=UPI0037C790DA